MPQIATIRIIFLRSTLFLCVGLFLAGCSGQSADRTPQDGINDPFENFNRSVHAFNLGVDRTILRPASQGYVSALPEPVQDTVSNFTGNLNEPANAVNSLLQGDLRGVGVSTLRFVTNSTLGILGIVDAASEFGIRKNETDFGETLFVWGVGEGPMLELPLMGPSTTRHAMGRVVDFFTNPLAYRLDEPQRYYAVAALGVAGLGTRGRYSDTIDSVLYESADSYAQTRLVYLQNRRFQLEGSDAGTEIDPYELNTEGF